MKFILPYSLSFFQIQEQCFFIFFVSQKESTSSGLFYLVFKPECWFKNPRECLPRVKIEINYEDFTQIQLT